MSDAATDFAWQVGVLTCPRPGHPTLGVTLASLSSAGWPIRSIRIFYDFDRIGCYQAWLRGLRLLADHAPAGAWLLLAEDDGQHAAGLRGYLERPGQLDPNGWNSLYCAGTLHSCIHFGWREAAAPRQCWGSVSYAVTAEMARRFLADVPFPAWRDGTDRAVGHFCRRAAVPYRIHSPSFVRHVGLESSLDEPGGEAVNRQCAWWVAEISDRETGGGNVSSGNVESSRVGDRGPGAGDGPCDPGLGVDRGFFPAVFRVVRNSCDA
jgi:hypothetical protein